MKNFEFQGHRVCYVDEGSGTPILFLHNGGVSHRLWDHQIAHFAKTHRVIAPDLLGYGESDHPSIDYDFRLYQDLVEKLVDHLALPPFELVGCCVGGALALDYAARHPERVRHLAMVTVYSPVVGSASRIDPLTKLSSLGALGRRALSRLAGSGVPRRTVGPRFARAQCGPRTCASEPSFVTYVKRLYTEGANVRVMLRTDWSTFSPVDAITTLEVPSCLYWGRENALLSIASGEALAAKLQPARTEFWEEAGYMLMRERAADFNQSLEEFWGNRAAMAARA